MGRGVVGQMKWDGEGVGEGWGRGHRKGGGGWCEAREIGRGVVGQGMWGPRST